MSEVRGRSREDPMPEGRQPRGVTPRPRSGAAAEVPDCDSTTAKRSYPVSEVRGWLRGDTPRPRSGAVAGRSYPTPLSWRPGAAAGRSNPTSKDPWLRGRRRA